MKSPTVNAAAALGSVQIISFWLESKSNSYPFSFPQKNLIPPGPSRPSSRPGLPLRYPPRIALPPRRPPLPDPLALVPQTGQVADHPAQVLHAGLHASLPDVHAYGGHGHPERQPYGNSNPVYNRSAHHVQQLERDQGQQGEQSE